MSPRLRTAVLDVPTVPPAPRQRTYLYYSNENQSPAVSRAFLARQFRVLLRGQYEREHQNKFMDAADSYTTAADVDAAMGTGWTEQFEATPGLQYVFTVDLGLVHDPTVIDVGHPDDLGRIVVDRIITFQGSREEPVQLASVEACIKDLAARFPCWKIRIESWQGISAVQSLTALGLPVELVTPTAKLNSDEWAVLSQRLTTRTLILPVHSRLREELLNLTYEVGATGIKVVDRGAVHQDHAVAVRMLCAAFAAPVVIDIEPSADELRQLRSIAAYLGGPIIDDGLGFDDDEPAPLRLFIP